MRPKTRFYTWIIRIVGVFILAVGMYSPALAEDLPDLVVDKAHVGDFAQGDNDRVYTITVTNSSQLAPTSGDITLTDTLPAGLIAQSISGSDWACPTGDISALTTLICTRSTPLEATPSPASSSTITLTVDVAYNAATASATEDPGNPGVFYGTLTNTVNVSGGGDDLGGSNDDVTRILMKPDLRILGYELRNAANNAVIPNPAPGESFYIRMTIENRGGADTGNFYPGVFLDNKPNYGADHDYAPEGFPNESPLPLNLGDVTSISDYHITSAGPHNVKGCMYYNPAPSNPVNEANVVVTAERGNYTKPDFIPNLAAGSPPTTADVLIAYPAEAPYLYTDLIYDTDNVRNGLKAGSYNIHLYADPNCLVSESYEENNSFGPITLNAADTTPPSVVSSVLVNPSSTSLTNVGFTVTFSEIVAGVDISDFVLATTGVSSAQITGVSDIGGGVYTVSVYTGSGNGTIGLTVLDNDSIIDLSSNPLAAGFTSGVFYTVTKVIPPPTTLVNSVLPTSRSIQVGTMATIFNTVINAGVNPAVGVTLSMNPAPAGTFVYQQTSCATNAIIGSPNPSLDLNPGEVLCYVLSFTPSATFSATNVHIRAQALNAPSTNLLTGINTWLLRSTAVPGPDMIALTTTTDFHQVACSGTDVFAVAISNVGTTATGDVTAVASTGAASLPISLYIVETNPATGVIVGDHILQNVGAGENRTVAVFVTYNGCVTFDPANHRIFIEFRDGSNNVVGSTSTAISTNR